MNLYELTVAEAMSRMAIGDLTSEALTRSCLDRIDQVDGEVGAFITLDREGALEQARKADSERRRGRVGTLCGIPVAMKDLLCTKGMRTTCGSKILADFIPPYDATVVEKSEDREVSSWARCRWMNSPWVQPPNPVPSAYRKTHGKRVCRRRLFRRIGGGGLRR